MKSFAALCIVFVAVAFAEQGDRDKRQLALPLPLQYGPIVPAARSVVGVHHLDLGWGHPAWRGWNHLVHPLSPRIVDPVYDPRLINPLIGSLGPIGPLGPLGSLGPLGPLGSLGPIGSPLVAPVAAPVVSRRLVPGIDF